jgi:hypothetical protein
MNGLQEFSKEGRAEYPPHKIGSINLVSGEKLGDGVIVRSHRSYNHKNLLPSLTSIVMMS